MKEMEKVLCTLGACSLFKYHINNKHHARMCVCLFENSSLSLTYSLCLQRVINFIEREMRVKYFKLFTLQSIFKDTFKSEEKKHFFQILSTTSFHTIFFYALSLSLLRGHR